MARRFQSSNEGDEYSNSSPRARKGKRQERMERQPKEDKGFHKTTAAAEARLARHKVVPQTPGQELLQKSLGTKALTIVTGPAGSGKTYMAVNAAAQALAKKEVQSILITRTMVTVGKEIGHLPGTEIDKMLPYVAPMIEALNEFFGKEEVAKMVKADIIRVVPIALLRGYTFKNAYVLLDEAQNTTPHEFKTILTRMGEGSTMVVMADVEQSDIRTAGFVGGPTDFVRRMNAHQQDIGAEGHQDIGVVELTEDDVVRSGLCRDILNIYKTDY